MERPEACEGRQRGMSVYPPWEAHRRVQGAWLAAAVPEAEAPACSLAPQHRGDARARLRP